MFDVSDSLTIITDRLNRLTGKMTRSMMEDVFLDDDQLSVTARLIAADSVEKAFSGLFPGAWEFTHGATANLRVASLRQSQALSAVAA